MDIIKTITNFFRILEAEIHHEKMAFVYSQAYNLQLEGHVFPAVKFEQIYELALMDDEFRKAEYFEPEIASEEDLQLVHSIDYLDDFLNLRWTNSTKYSELPLNPQIVDAFRTAVGGTIKAMELTEHFPYVYNIGGGFHHSFPERAEGFCYLNDVAIAAKKYRKLHPDKKVLLIDLDVHQGNGNSLIFQDEPEVMTFSMHQENLYPLKQNSDLDVGLEDYCSGEKYLQLLRNHLTEIESGFKPDLIFYLAGADPFEEDRLGNLRLSLEDLAERDRIVKNYAVKNDARVVIVTAGGYARNTIDTVRIHLQTARVFHRK